MYLSIICIDLDFGWYFQAKLQARRNRRTAECQRKLEEDEAQRVIAEQRKQMQQQQTTTDGRSSPVAMDTGLLRTPKVDITESVEEKALKKEQVREVWAF